MDAVRALADVFEEQDRAARDIEAPTACPASAVSWVSVPPTSMPDASPWAQHLEARSGSSTERLRRSITARRNDASSYAAGPVDSRRSIIGP